MAPCTERDQVLLGIIAGVAAKLFVVDLKVRHRAAQLTPPAIAPLHLLPSSFVRHGIPAASARALGQSSS